MLIGIQYVHIAPTYEHRARLEVAVDGRWIGGLRLQTIICADKEHYFITTCTTTKIRCFASRSVYTCTVIEVNPKWLATSSTHFQLGSVPTY